MLGGATDVFTTTTSAFDTAEVDPSRVTVAVSTCVPSASFVGTRHDQSWSKRFLTVQTTAPPLSRTVTVTMSSSSSSSSVISHELPVRTGTAFLEGDGVWSMVGAASPRVRTTKSIPEEEKVPAAAVHVYPPSSSCWLQDHVWSAATLVLQVWVASLPSVAVTAIAVPAAELLRPANVTLRELITSACAGKLGATSESNCESRAAGSHPWAEPHPPDRSAATNKGVATK